MRIEKYVFGRITIDGQTYEQDVIVYPDRVDPFWWRREGHSLDPADLADVVRAQPEVLVIGRGANGVLTVPPATRQFLAEQGIELVALATGEACARFNQLLAAGQRVVAGLHLTC